MAPKAKIRPGNGVQNDRIGLSRIELDTVGCRTGTQTPKYYKKANDIPEKRRVQINCLLNQRLANAIDLQMQIKQAHWNVKGPNFIGLHELFDQIDEAVESYVDLIARAPKRAPAVLALVGDCRDL